jgi:hypothetical protein
MNYRVIMELDDTAGDPDRGPETSLICALCMSSFVNKKELRDHYRVVHKSSLGSSVRIPGRVIQLHDDSVIHY